MRQCMGRCLRSGWLFIFFPSQRFFVFVRLALLRTSMRYMRPLLHMVPNPMNDSCLWRLGRCAPCRWMGRRKRWASELAAACPTATHTARAHTPSIPAVYRCRGTAFYCFFSFISLTFTLLLQSGDFGGTLFRTLLLIACVGIIIKGAQRTRSSSLR